MKTSNDCAGRAGALGRNLGFGFAIVGLLLGAARAAEPTFNFDTVRFRAKVLAERPYVAPASRVPEWLTKLSYDEHRLIRFDPGHTWWRDEKRPVLAALKTKA